MNCCLLFNISALRRVLPLPSDSWDEFGEGVFCHYHGDNQKCSVEGEVVYVAPAGIKLAPKVGECLISSTVLLLTEESLNMPNILKVSVFVFDVIL